MNYCDRSALEGRTREYWNEFDHGNIEPCTEWYITNLLPDEMACAEKRNALPTNESCDLLSLCCNPFGPTGPKECCSYSITATDDACQARCGERWSQD